MNSRRSFITKMGAGVSAAVASTAGMASVDAGAEAKAGTSEDLALKAALLEDEQAIRRIHQVFEQAMDMTLHEQVIAMFTDDAEVVFNGGVFKHRSHGVSRLYREHFQAGNIGRRMEPAPGFELDADRQRDSVEVSADRLSATAVFPYSIQVGAPIESETSLADMARLHGEGVQTWWEGGEYQVGYRKNAADGRWRISRLEYSTLARADYRSGRSYASKISVPRFLARFPGNPKGPDELV